MNNFVIQTHITIISLVRCQGSIVNFLRQTPRGTQKLYNLHLDKGRFNRIYIFYLKVSPIIDTSTNGETQI